MQKPAWACSSCANLIRDDVNDDNLDGPGRCKAFDKIPMSIWNGQNDHTQPFAGDGGIRYERLDFGVNDGLTAAADVLSGAMIALIPQGADLDEIVIDEQPDAEPIDQLHLTLFYLGDAADIDPAQQQQIIDLVQLVADTQVSIEAIGFGAAVFNPDGEEPCLTLLVSGDDLAEFRGRVEDGLEALEVDLSLQHEPWVPHITLLYSGEPWRYIDLATTRTGSILFDRIRVAFAGQVTDFTLTDVEDLPLDAMVAHLGGKHNQKSHGHGGGGPMATVDDSKIKKARSSYDERVGKAKTEGAVYTATPLGMGKSGAPPENAEVVGALENYAGGSGHHDVNAGLRNAHGHAEDVVRPPGQSGSAPSKIKSDEELRATIGTMDRGMDASHLTDDVVLHRVVADPERLFGSAYHRDGDNSGLTWHDHGFTSTTLSVHGIEFQQGRLRGGVESPEPGGQLVMHILAPKGTHALIGNNREGEIILDRGLQFRVVRDHGIPDRTRHDMELGITKSYERHIDVEIIE